MKILPYNYKRYFITQMTVLTSQANYKSKDSVIINISPLLKTENRTPIRIFGPKRDENRDWRRLHNEELHSLNVHLIYSGWLNLEG